MDFWIEGDIRFGEGNIGLRDHIIWNRNEMRHMFWMVWYNIYMLSWDKKGNVPWEDRNGNRYIMGKKGFGEYQDLWGRGIGFCQDFGRELGI